MCTPSSKSWIVVFVVGLEVLNSVELLCDHVYCKKRNTNEIDLTWLGSSTPAKLFLTITPQFNKQV